MLQASSYLAGKNTLDLCSYDLDDDIGLGVFNRTKSCQSLMSGSLAGSDMVSTVSSLSMDSSPIDDTRTRSLRKVQQDLEAVGQDDDWWGWIRSTLRQMDCRAGQDHWIRTGCANVFFGSVIIINAVFIGFETDYNRPNQEATIHKDFWFTVETVFLCTFIIELVLRVKAERLEIFFDVWNVFDMVIVLLGVVDTWIFRGISLDSEASDDLQTLTLFRLARLIRIARILRIIRLLRFIRELLLLVKGMLGALKALGWAFLLILIVLYVSAVICTEFIRDQFPVGARQPADLHQWFGSVGSSVLTLFQLMTLEGWPEIVRAVAIDSHKPWLLLFLMPFLCCTNFALLNVVTAVMVEKVFEFAEDEKVNEAKRSHKERKIAIQKICKLFTDIDEDKNGSLTIQELKNAVTAEDSCTRQFQDLGIAKHDIDSLFQCIDVDGNGELSAVEFIEGCLRMHGLATSKDLLRIQYDVHRTRKRLDIKKLTRLMSWSSWCLQSDFEANTPSHGRSARRRSTGVGCAQMRSRSTSMDGDNNLCGKSLVPPMPPARNVGLISRRASDFACGQSAQMTRCGSLLNRANRARRASIGTIMPCMEGISGSCEGAFSSSVSARSSAAAAAADDSGEDQLVTLGGSKLRPRCEVRSKTAPAASRSGGHGSHRRRSKLDLAASNRDPKSVSDNRFASNVSNASSSNVSADASSSNAPSLTSAASAAQALGGTPLGGAVAAAGSEHELPLPPEAHQLLAAMLEEQRQTHELLDVLSEEVRALRSRAKHCETGGGAGGTIAGPIGGGGGAGDGENVANASLTPAAAERKALPLGAFGGGRASASSAAATSKGVQDGKIQLQRSMTGNFEIEGRAHRSAASNLFAILKGARQRVPSDEGCATTAPKGLKRSKSWHLR